MSEYIKALKLPIAIIGMGKSGRAAKRLLLAAGVEAKNIITFDKNSADADMHDANQLLQNFHPQTLVVSPGVPLKTDWIAASRANGVHITSEINLACSLLQNEKIVGVTGSVGKSTTVSLLGEGLQAFCANFFVGGNLGTPFADYISEVLENKRPRADWVVLELSSYQLENCALLKLDFSGITFLTANHLERYTNQDEYYKTKWHIFDITRNATVLNEQGGDIVSFLKQHPRPQAFLSRVDASDLTAFELHKSDLLGQHNHENLAMAAHIAILCRWPGAAIQQMKKFKGLQHRLETVGTYRSILFVNDSKATAMDSVLTAAKAGLQKVSTQNKLWLLLGGKDKNLPWEDLQVLHKNQNIRFLFFGECATVAQKKSLLPGPTFQKLSLAIEAALQQAQAGDCVLLSPGGTSLDEFKNFEERGEFFKSTVHSFMKVQNR